MQFGPYELKHRLGAGGMGEVFLASQTLSQGVRRRVVIKRMLPHLSSDARFAETFVQEAAILAQLNHPNIATLFDFGELSGQYYLAIEYLDGFDLSALLAATAGPLPVAIALRIAVDVAAALHHAHEATDENGRALNVIHRDVTPSNLFITQSGRVKVLDFGVARTSAAVHQTTTGVLKGKYSYFAPEQIRREPFDRRVDVFALALVLYEALTRYHPFRREGEFQTLTAIVAERAPPLSAKGGPAWLDAVLTRALDPDPAQRFATMLAFGDALTQAAAAAALPLASDDTIAKWLAAVQPVRPVISASSDEPLPSDTRTLSTGDSVPVKDVERTVRAPPPPTQRTAMPVRLILSTIGALGLAFGAMMLLRAETPAQPKPAPVITEPASAPITTPPVVVSPPTVVTPPKVVTPSPQPKGAPAKARIKIMLPDWGATLFIDGAEVDDGPPWKNADGVSVAPGAHTVRLVNSALGIDARYSLKLTPGQHKVLTVSRADAAKGTK